jgi:hypothetical protein
LKQACSPRKLFAESVKAAEIDLTRQKAALESLKDQTRMMQAKANTFLKQNDKE